MIPKLTNLAKSDTLCPYVQSLRLSVRVFEDDGEGSNYSGLRGERMWITSVASISPGSNQRLHHRSYEGAERRR